MFVKLRCWVIPTYAWATNSLAVISLLRSVGHALNSYVNNNLTCLLQSLQDFVRHVILDHSFGYQNFVKAEIVGPDCPVCGLHGRPENGDILSL